MEINVSTTYNYDMFKRFFRFSLFKKKNYKKRRIFLLLLFSLAFLLVIVSAVAFDNYSSMIPQLVIMIFLSLFMVFIYCFLPKIQYSKSSLKDTQNDFSFRDDKLIVDSKSNGITGSSDIDYSSLQKVFETDDSFYLFISLNQAFLINKKNIDSITENDLRNLLMSKVQPKKYIICK